MRKILAVIIVGLFLIGQAVAQQGTAVGPVAPCSAFGTTAGTCLQGNGTAANATSVAGTDQTTAWTAYTPTLTCTAGTLTTATTTAASKALGKTIFIHVKIVISVLGTCTGDITMTLPIAPASDNVLSGKENQLTGLAINVALNSGSTTTGGIKTATNGTLSALGTLLLSGVYESQ